MKLKTKSLQQQRLEKLYGKKNVRFAQKLDRQKIIHDAIAIKPGMTEGIIDGIIGRLPNGHKLCPFLILYRAVNKQIANVTTETHEEDRLQAEFVSVLNAQFALLLSEAFRGKNANWDALLKNPDRENSIILVAKGAVIHIGQDLAVALLRTAQIMEKKRRKNIFKDSRFNDTYQMLLGFLLQTMAVLKSMPMEGAVLSLGFDVLHKLPGISGVIMKQFRDISWRAAEASYKPGSGAQSIARKQQAFLDTITSESLEKLSMLNTVEDLVKIFYLKVFAIANFIAMPL